LLLIEFFNFTECLLAFFKEVEYSHDQLGWQPLFINTCISQTGKVYNLVFLCAQNIDYLSRIQELKQAL
jgi:hypothetical protein